MFEHEEIKELRRILAELREQSLQNKEIIRLLKQLTNTSQGVVSLRLIQIGDSMAFQNSIIGLTPGQTAKFQIVPLDANGNPDALIPGTTLTYQSSDSANAPASADPADASGLTMQVPVSSAIAAGAQVTLTVTASAQADGTQPTTGPVVVAVLTLAVKTLGLNQIQ
jgi:hypothetical protein